MEENIHSSSSLPDPYRSYEPVQSYGSGIPNFDPFAPQFRGCRHSFDYTPSNNNYCRFCGLYVHMGNEFFSGAEYQPNPNGMPIFNVGDKVFIKNSDKLGVTKSIWGIVHGSQIDFNPSDNRPTYIYYVEIKDGFDVPMAPTGRGDDNKFIVTHVALRFFEFQLCHIKEEFHDHTSNPKPPTMKVEDDSLTL